MFKLIVQALPGTGKTTLAERLSRDGFTVIDSDVVWFNLDGTEKEWDEFISELSGLATGDTILFTNCWIEELVPCERYAKYFPEWNTWIETVMDNRKDLQTLGFGTLKSWYDDYLNDDQAIMLEKDQYLSDAGITV